MHRVSRTGPCYKHLTALDYEFLGNEGSGVTGNWEVSLALPGLLSQSTAYASCTGVSGKHDWSQGRPALDIQNFLV